MAYGPAFADEMKPLPMITVGRGEIGTAELQNLMFTSRGALPGLLLVKWNIKTQVKGSVGMWGKESHHLAYASFKFITLTWSDRLSLPSWWRGRHLANSSRLSQAHRGGAIEMHCRINHVAGHQLCQWV
jgi:hypothetical protein